MFIKNTILDTNVIIDYPKSLMEYDNVIVPYVILEELDKLNHFSKSRTTKYQARKARDYIYNNNITCKKLIDTFDENYYTDDILVGLSQTSQYKVITGDLLMYLKGKSLGGDIELYKRDTDTYTGVKTMMLDQDIIDTVYEKGIAKTYSTELFENQFIEIINSPLSVRYKDGYLFKVDRNKKLDDLHKLNRRQCMALDLLYDKDVQVVCLWGTAGTGKTAISIKSALRMVKNGDYGQVMVSRPMIQDGSKEEKLGTLPGDKYEKTAPFTMPFKDNMKHMQYSECDFPDVQPLTTVKGRSIEDTIYIIDESQDIPPEKMPKLVERMGRNSKLIITGDPRQIDNKNLNESYNGISFLCNSLKGQKAFGCVQLDKNERKGASLLGDILRDKL
ncbi:MAG: PhoH family protein [bacterium]